MLEDFFKDENYREISGGGIGVKHVTVANASLKS